MLFIHKMKLIKLYYNLESSYMENIKLKEFYGKDRGKHYQQNYNELKAKDVHHYPSLKSFIDNYSLKENKACLEIGSSGGFFQDMVENYHGTDIVEELRQYYHKPYTIAEGTSYPFKDGEFDAIWTFAVYEHIPHLQEAMLEIKRMLKKDGVALFEPAWQCRTWAADGYTVRPYSDFGLKGKLIKASIPLRDSVIWRSMFIFPKRILRHAAYLMGYKYTKIRYKKITANYDTFWVSDGDACNYIDAHDAILWFKSHGFKCLSHPTHLKALLVRTGGLVFQKE